MNNKKGFTIIEVVLAFTFAVILLASMFVIVINYQNRAEKEKIISNLLTYKNGILEIVYQDVISNDIDSMKSCGNKCFEFKTSTDTYKLEGKTDADGNNYLTYRDNNYVLPDSKNNLSKFRDFEYDYDEDNKIFKVNIPVIHAELEDEENDENTIEIVISGKEFEKPVSKLENPVVVTPIEGLIYNDSDYELIEVKRQKGNIYFSTTEFLDGSNYNKGTSDIPKKKDAGTYTVYYYVTGDDDYLPKGGTIEVSIGKRKVTYKADDANKGYDGTALEQKTATLIDGTIVEGHTVTFIIEGSITNEGEVPNVLKDVIIKDLNGNNVTSNYEITKVNGKLKIELVCEWVLTSETQADTCTNVNKPSNPVKNSTYVDCGESTYKGTRFTLRSSTCANGHTISGTTSGYTFTSASSALNSCITTRGINENNAIASGACDKISSQGQCTTQSKYSYNKKEYTYQCSSNKDTITISEKTSPYTGSEIPANDAILSSGGNASYVYYPNQNCSGDPLGGPPINVGNYSVQVISDGGNNYLGNSVCIKHTITIGTPIITLTPKSSPYTGEPIEPGLPSAKNESGNPEYLEYDYEYYEGNTCSGTKLTSAPINVGKYSVIAVSRSTDNLKSSKSNCVSIEIGKQELELTVTAEDKVYDGTTNATCKLVLNNVVSGEDVSISATGSFDNKNAGTNKQVTCSDIKLTGADADNYKLITTTVTTTANINKYTPLLEINPTSKSISAKERAAFMITPTAIDACKGTVVATSANTNYVKITSGATINDVATGRLIAIMYEGVSYTTGTNITISYTPIDTVNCNSAENKNFVASVTRLTPTISLSASTTAYTGSAITANNAITTSNGTVTYTYYNGENCSGNPLSGAPTNVGKYSVIAKVEQTGVYEAATSSCVKHTINKYTPTLELSATSGSVEANSTKTFTSTPTTINACKGTLVATSDGTSYVTITGGASTSNAPGGTAVTITYKGISYTTGTNITVTYTPTDTTNCNSASSKTFSASVTKITPTISLSPRSESYTGSPITANTATTNSNGSITYQYYTENCTSTINGAPTNVGNYGVKATVSATGIYNSATTGCVAHTITNKSSNVIKPTSSSHCKSVTYNGVEQTITNSAGTEYDFSGNKGTIAKTYTVTATLKAGYTWQDGSITPVTFDCSIAKREITYKADDATKVYDGTALTKNTATLISGELVSGHTATSNISGTITNAGSVTNTLNSVVIKSGSTDVTSNYDITLQNGTLKVTKVDNQISITGVSINENGNEQELIGSVSGANGTVYYSLDGPLNESNYTTGDTKIPKAKADGTYIIYYYVTGDSNHNSESGSVTSTLKKVTTAPSCSFAGPSTSFIKKDSTAIYTLTCTDTWGFTDSTISTSDFTLSNTGIVSISSPTRTTVSGGYQYTIVVTGANQGTATLTLKSDALSNKLGNTNTAVTSSGVSVDTTPPTVSYSIAGGVHDGAQSVTVTATDTGGSGFNYMDIHVYQDGVMNSTKTINTHRSTTATITLDAGSYWVIYTKVYDKAGNVIDPDPDNGDGWYYQEYWCAAYVTFDSTNLVYGLANVSSTTDQRVTYSISNGVVTVKALRDDAYLYTNAKVYLEAGRYYNFSVTTNGTWGGGTGTVESYFMNETTGNHIRMDTANFTFTPSESGVYQIRFDVNTNGQQYTFSNIIVKEIVRNGFVKGNNYPIPDAPVRPGYSFVGWYTEASDGTQVTASTIITTTSSHTIYAHWTQETASCTEKKECGCEILSDWISQGKTPRTGSCASPPNSTLSTQRWTNCQATSSNDNGTCNFSCDYAIKACQKYKCC